MKSGSSFAHSTARQKCCQQAHFMYMSLTHSPTHSFTRSPRQRQKERHRNSIIEMAYTTIRKQTEKRRNFSIYFHAIYYCNVDWAYGFACYLGSVGSVEFVHDVVRPPARSSPVHMPDPSLVGMFCMCSCRLGQIIKCRQCLYVASAVRSSLLMLLRRLLLLLLLRLLPLLLILHYFTLLLFFPSFDYFSKE